jgi:hypothetical protein
VTTQKTKFRTPVENAITAIGSPKPNSSAARSRRRPPRSAPSSGLPPPRPRQISQSSGSSTAPPVCLVSAAPAVAAPAGAQRRFCANQKAAAVPGSMNTSKVAAWLSSGESPIDTST